MSLLRKWSIAALLLVVFVIGVIWSTENSQAVSIVFLNFETSARPVSHWVAGALVVGSLGGYLLASWSNARLRLTVARTRRQLRRQTQMVDELRATPSSPEPPTEGS